MTTPLLILAGHDPTGGAGLIADAATARALCCHPLTVPTVLTVQNSMRFTGGRPVDPRHIADAIAALVAEFTFDTVKIGLIPVDDDRWIDALIPLVAERCRHIVIDPVLKATAADNAATPNAAFLRLISLPGTVITPNRRELDRIAAALDIAPSEPGPTARAVAAATGAAVVVTFEGAAPHILIAENGALATIPVTLIPLDRPVHGTGCRLATAIACGLATGMTLSDAAARAAGHLSDTLSRRERFHPDGQDYPL